MKVAHLNWHTVGCDLTSVNWQDIVPSNVDG